ncbi:MAG: class I SAM-dependent methyltransferase [Chloroflexota bacterium]|nr:MAG: class I SAM-dependent methyltransferase [Chloroflexota bacterium]
MTTIVLEMTANHNEDEGFATMDDSTRELYERLAERYASGDVPWDDPLPPPEVVNHVAGLHPGRALDLGCGYGRASIYLAGLGWKVDGIDFIPDAIAEAARRAKAVGVKARFHISAATDLDYLAGPYDFALDVGCCHNMNGEDLVRYRDQLCRLVRPDGDFMLFARLREDEGDQDDGPGGISREELEQVFASCFKLTRMERGSTEVPGQASWPSAWFWYTRR